MRRVQRSEGRLRELDADAAAQLMLDDALEGEMSAMLLLIRLAEGKKRR